MLYTAVRYLGQDPYQLYNRLGPDFRPLYITEDAEPRPPRFPVRVQTFLYGCGAFASEEEVQKIKAMVGGATRRAIGG